MFHQVLEYMLLNNIISQEFHNWLNENGFKTVPASTKYHGAYEGGLFDHSCAVTEELLCFTQKLDLKWQREASPYIIGMFHDLCKIDAYKPIEGIEHAWEYNTDVLIRGHGEKSIMLLSQFMTLTEEEILCIRYHMGAYEKDDWAELDRAIKKYPTVLYTHTADMLASKLKA